MKSDWLTSFLTPLKYKFSNYLISTSIYIRMQKILLTEPIALEIPHLRILKSDWQRAFLNMAY